MIIYPVLVQTCRVDFKIGSDDECSEFAVTAVTLQIYDLHSSMLKVTF